MFTALLQWLNLLISSLFFFFFCLVLSIPFIFALLICIESFIHMAAVTASRAKAIISPPFHILILQTSISVIPLLLWPYLI